MKTKPIRIVVFVLVLILMTLFQLSCLSDGDETLVFPTNERGQTTRTTDNQGTWVLPEPNIELALWDHMSIDGDIVSVFLDNVAVVSRLLLDGPDNKFVLHLTLPQKQNELVLFAHNEGTSPPNTAAISVKSGSFYQERVISANLTTNGSITLIVE